jgi:hypothetical protein
MQGEEKQWIEYMALSVLIGMRHHGNPKKHDHGELADSFVRFGFIAFPTIDETSLIMVAGHGRCETLQMMKEMGQTPPRRIQIGDRGEWMVPVIRGIAFENDDERDAYLVADNRHVIKGGMNEEAERSLLRALYERNPEHGLDGLGLGDTYLEDLLADVGGGELDDLDDGDPDVVRDGSGGKEVEVSPHTRTIGATPAPEHKVRPPKQMTNEDWKLTLGDCIDELKKIEDAVIDVMVTDPPAGIGFMNKEWDSDKGGRDQWIEWLAGRAARGVPRAQARGLGAGVGAAAHVALDGHGARGRRLRDL